MYGSDGEQDTDRGEKGRFMVLVCGGGRNLFFSGGIDLAAVVLDEGGWLAEVEGLMSEGY